MDLSLRFSNLLLDKVGEAWTNLDLITSRRSLRFKNRMMRRTIMAKNR
jgi:hypothetical protein